MKAIYDFIKSCGTYYLSTVDSEGQPHVRPFGTINIFEDKLYIQTGKAKDVSKQIQENPKVELCCFNGKEWIRLSGELVRDERVEPKEDMLNHYPDLKKIYSATDENTEVLYFKNAVATISSFTSAPKVIQL